MVLHENDFWVIGHEPDTAAISIEWREATSQMSFDDFKEALRLLGRYANENQAKHLLIDVTGFRFQVNDETEEWRQAEIVPAYIEAGITKFARVANGMTYCPPTTGANEPYESADFASADDARTWFRAS